MSILCWDKPKKAMPAAQHNRMYSSDCGVPGTYVPNMSDEDNHKWKAKRIKGSDPRIEVRKKCEGRYIPPEPGSLCGHHEGAAQVLIVARPDGSVQFSMNAKALFDITELEQVLEEIRAEMAAA